MTNTQVCTAAALFLVSLSARAFDPPELKEGLWEIHGQSIENPGGKKSEFTYKLCRDHAYDKEAEALAKSVKGCVIDMKAVGPGSFSSEGHCKVAGTDVTSKGTGVYQSNTSTHSESHTTYTPAFYGVTDDATTQDQKYLGSCPAGMKAGDRITADGTVKHHK